MLFDKLKFSMLPKSLRERLVQNLDSQQRKCFDKWNASLRALIILLVVIVICGYGHAPIGLTEPEPHGFLLWFLVILCFPMLPILGLLNILSNYCFEQSLEMMFLNNQFLVLGIVALVEMIFLAFLGRVVLKVCDKYQIFLDLARDTAWMVWAYGIFSFLCFLSMFIWAHGGFHFF